MGVEVGLVSDKIPTKEQGGNKIFFGVINSKTRESGFFYIFSSFELHWVVLADYPERYYAPLGLSYTKFYLDKVLCGKLLLSFGIYPIRLDLPESQRGAGTIKLPELLL